ncbi:MAG: DUF971 domain-containing protein [Pseudomonadales bacterium]|nr:DUF971 domain-containing protein [Pseudomonadales bacterium]
MLPAAIRLHKKTAVLELSYPDGGIYTLPAEFLRVYSPSAEVRGHGSGQEVLQTGKRHVRINSLESIGNYGIKPHFDDDHNTGIYTWEYLRELCLRQTELWEDYLRRLQQAGASRDHLPEGVQVVTIQDLK